MQTAWFRALRALCVAYVAATVVHIGWDMAQDTHAQPFTVGRFANYWWFEYTHSNPRIGQAFTYLAYKLEYFAVIATPLAHVGLAIAAFVVATARLPSWRRGRDLALVMI